MALKQDFKNQKFLNDEDRRELEITAKLIFHESLTVELIDLAINNLLKTLTLEYIDIVFISFPDGFDPNHIKDRWQALENLVILGKVLKIGISGITKNALIDLLSYAKVKPYIIQSSSNKKKYDEDLVSFAKEHQIKITSIPKTDLFYTKQLNDDKSNLEWIMRYNVIQLRNAMILTQGYIFGLAY